MKKILLLGSQHGNELLGEKLSMYIKVHAPDLLPYVTFRIGNPKARRAGVRYVESDMNRSYGPTLTTYEASRAVLIETYIKKQQFDLVLDLHTTVCVQPPCLLVASITDAHRSFLKATSIDRVIVMQHSLVETSLIGNVPSAISIEVANDDISKELLAALSEDIRRYIANEEANKELKQYVVDSLILKSSISSEAALKLRNFKMSSLGFIPMLVGENSYKKNTRYLGFKASKETIIRL